jgi:hypothetical protein
MEIRLTMRDSVDYIVASFKKVIFLVRSERNRLLAKNFKLSALLNAFISGKKRWGRLENRKSWLMPHNSGLLNPDH